MPRATSATKGVSKATAAKKASTKASTKSVQVKKATKTVSKAASTSAKKATKAAPAKKAAKQAAPVKKAAKQAAPAKKAAKQAAPAKKAAKEAAPAKKAAKEAAPAKKAAKEAAPAKKATKAAPAKDSATGAASAKKPQFDAKFLEQQRALLLEERATYLRQAEHLQAEADELAAMREPGDVQFDEESGEGDTLAVERERDLALSAQARAMIEDIDRALAKIDDGTYGICEVSGLAIPKERLRAIPWARERVEYKVGGFGRR
ncbi:MAG: TraR/DksA C4-type zinc finger protein [Acidimicrobiales bacterium]|nr:TraR/DksA C4-type zinc finger protein [Acidimicrobiales bacterium]